MKNNKRLLSILLVAVMAIGMTMTAIAATNGSMNYQGPTDEDKVAWVNNYVYSNATIAAGQGTIAKVTDKEVLVSAYNQSDEIYGFVWQKVGAVLKDNNQEAYVTDYVLFDVQGVTSGEVTVQLKDEGLADAKGMLAVVSHYNASTKKWEQMDKLAEIDDQCRVTFNFNSYSPILISVTNVKASDLKENSGFGIQKATMTPQQVASGAAKAPKMGE